MNAEQVAEEALNLPIHDRVNLAQVLWESFAAQPATEEGSDLSQTVLRRGRELDEGVVTGISREDALAQAREAVR